MHPPPPDRSRASAGFTLVEILVSLTIMSFVMVALYMIVNVTMGTRDLLEREVHASRLGPSILDRLEQDLRRAWILNIEGDRIFLGEDRSLLGEAADSLVLLTTVDGTLTRRVGDRDVVSDVCETGYRLRVNPEVPDVLELWRRESFHVDEEPLQQGSYERLHDRVVALDFKYYEDNEERTEPRERWDAAEEHALPAMIVIRLGLEVGSRASAEGSSAAPGTRTRWYERLVSLRPDHDPSAALALRVHPLPPTFIVAAADGGPGGGGGGEGGGGKGGTGGVSGDTQGGGTPGHGGGPPGQGGGSGGPPPGGGGPGGGSGLPGLPGGGGSAGGSGSDVDLAELLKKLFSQK